MIYLNITNLPIPLVKNRFESEVEPVSYTHLDVYKRQDIISDHVISYRQAHPPF